jgi:cysteine desulfuration protein SufE
MLSDDLTSVSLTALSQVDNWQAKYRLLTQWGALIQPKPLMRRAQYRLNGCEVAAWLSHEQVDGRHRFYFDSDSRIINGLAALLMAQINNKSRADIDAQDFSQLLLTAGLAKHLTPSRNNGFNALVARARSYLKV